MADLLKVKCPFCKKQVNASPADKHGNSKIRKHGDCVGGVCSVPTVPQYPRKEK